MLAKYELTQGEIVANGAYYNALIPNISPAQLLQPFLDYAFGFRRGVNAGQPPDNAGPRAELPFPVNGIPQPGDLPPRCNRKRLVDWSRPSPWPSLSWPGAAFLVRQVFFGPNTITAYFPTATAIYPGDEVRVSGVKVGKIDSIKPDGTQTKMILEGRPRRAGAGRRQGRDRRPEPGRGPLRPAHAGLPQGRRTDDGVTARSFPATEPRYPSSGMR